MPSYGEERDDAASDKQENALSGNFFLCKNFFFIYINSYRMSHTLWLIRYVPNGPFGMVHPIQTQFETLFLIFL